LGVITVRTGTFHIAVGQKAPTFRAIGLRYGILIDIALFQQLKKNIMCGLSMVRYAGISKQVPGYAQLLPAIEKLFVVSIHYLLRRLLLLFGT
jgi:hypothetical protein